MQICQTIFIRMRSIRAVYVCMLCLWWNLCIHFFYLLVENLFYLCLMNTNEVIMIWNVSVLYYFVVIFCAGKLWAFAYFFSRSHCIFFVLCWSIRAQNFDGIMDVFSVSFEGYVSKWAHTSDEENMRNIYFHLLENTPETQRNALISVTCNITELFDAYPRNKDMSLCHACKVIFFFWMIRCGIWSWSSCLFIFCYSLFIEDTQDATEREWRWAHCVKMETLCFDSLILHTINIYGVALNWTVFHLKMLFFFVFESVFLYSGEASVTTFYLQNPSEQFVGAISYCLEICVLKDGLTRSLSHSLSIHLFLSSSVLVLYVHCT